MPKSPPPASPAEDKPRRLSLSQILEHMLTRNAGEKSVVGLTRNASGETQIDVRVSTGTEGEAATIEEAERKASAVYDRLRAQYPPRPSHDNTTIELTRNAKGETQIEVAVRTSDTGATTATDAEKLAMEIYDRTRRQYPMVSGLTATPGSVKAS